MPSLKYIEVDEIGQPTGRTVEFADAEFKPLGFVELAAAKPSLPITIRLEGHGAAVGSLPDFEIARPASFSTTLQSHFASLAIGLVPGGWLPSALAVHDGTIIMPDRCIFAQIDARFEQGKPRSTINPDFLDLFAGSAVHINPALFVLEGNMRRTPTEAEARAQPAEAVAKLMSALPKAKLIAATDVGLKGILGLIAESAASQETKQDFLLSVAPLLSTSIGKKSIARVWNEVVAAAERYQLPTRSLVVLAALSTILMPQSMNPARSLCKFGPNFSRSDAYNVLADLRSLEILIYTFAVFREKRTMLCTADRALALFWSGLRASNFEYKAGKVLFTIHPSELLPGMTDEQRATLCGATQLNSV